jgi:ABC-type antimicrobial peptide transport system permease subunit
VTEEVPLLVENCLTHLVLQVYLGIRISLWAIIRSDVIFELFLVVLSVNTLGLAMEVNYFAKLFVDSSLGGRKYHLKDFNAIGLICLLLHSIGVSLRLYPY